MKQPVVDEMFDQIDEEVRIFNIMKNKQIEIFFNFVFSKLLACWWILLKKMFTQNFTMILKIYLMRMIFNLD
jgi:hypothetical protein